MEVLSDLSKNSGSAFRASPGAQFGDGTNAASVVAGKVFYVRVGYTGKIVGWNLVADVACSLTMRVWKLAGDVPTAANSIVASAKPTLSSAKVASSSTLTGWTTDVTAGDVLAFELETLTSGSPKQVNFNLTVQ